MLASATNDRQVKAIVDEVEDKLREIGSKPIRREGERDGRWVLIDYGEIVVHVQHEEERQFYALERLWRDCPAIELPADVTSARAVSEGRTLVLLRHGRTPWNHSGRIQGHADVELDDHGVAQAARTAPVLAALQPALIWSSDLLRARLTAAPLAEACGLPVTTDARLREFGFGPYEGLTHVEPSRPATPPSHAALRRGDYDQVTRRRADRRRPRPDARRAHRPAPRAVAGGDRGRRQPRGRRTARRRLRCSAGPTSSSAPCAASTTAVGWSCTSTRPTACSGSRPTTAPSPEGRETSGGTRFHIAGRRWLKYDEFAGVWRSW